MIWSPDETPDETPDVAAQLGDQAPRLLSLPEYDSTEAGREAVELAAQAGLVLDPWQQLVLEQGLAEKDGKWAAFEVGLILPRQNGKGSILEARELAGLFLFDEELILHSAHDFKTAAEAFRRIRLLIEDTPDLERRVRQIRTANGSEMIELRNGRRLRFVARTKGSGRGLTGDCVVLDEAYNLGDQEMAALLPTLSARPNPQVWYTSSAGDKTSVQLGRVRARGLTRADPALAFFEWSVDEEAFLRGEVDPTSPAHWRQANPALGIRINAEYIERERAALGPIDFARERLGVGDYPVDEATAWAVIPAEQWHGAFDRNSQLVEPFTFAIDVNIARDWTALAVAGRRADGLLHVEVVAHEPGTHWVVKRVKAMSDKWHPSAVVLDAGGPAGSLLAELESVGIEVTRPNTREVAQGCGLLYDAATDTKTLRHMGQQMLTQAVAGARRRPLGDAWAWDRKTKTVDISPLVAVTLAAWGFTAHIGEQYELLASVL